MKTTEFKKKIKTISDENLQRIYKIIFPINEDKLHLLKITEMREEISEFQGHDIFSKSFEILEKHIEKQETEDLVFFGEFFKLDITQSIENLKKEIYQYLCSPTHFSTNKKHQKKQTKSKEMKERKNSKDGKEEFITKKEQKERTILMKLKTSKDQVGNDLLELRDYIEKKLHYEMSLPSKRYLFQKNENDLENDIHINDGISNEIELQKPLKSKSLKCYDEKLHQNNSNTLNIQSKNDNEWNLLSDEDDETVFELF